MTTITLADRFRGTIVGLAAGDALGHPTEFMGFAQIIGRFGPRGIEDYAAAGRHAPGTFTDDTQMSIAVARALARRGQGDIDAVMATLADEFVAWARHPDNDRAPGGTCLQGCRALARGVPWRAAGVSGSKGCGAAMRAAPIGLWAYDDDGLLVRLAAAQSVLTHAHPTAVASSVAAAAPIAWLARGLGIDGMLAYTRERVAALDAEAMVALGVERRTAETIGVGEMLRALDRVGATSDAEADDVCTLHGGAWVGEEAVACAIWCFIKAGGDFAESVRRGATSSGDSDSIACIAGGFAGALHGLDGIPSHYRDGLERAADLVLLADELYAAKASGSDRTLPPRIDFFAAGVPRARD